MESDLFKVFSKVWQLNGHELRQWAFYHVILGLSPVWLSWICLAFISVFKFSDSFLNGSFLIFTATLSATSLAYFAEDVKIALPNAGRVIMCGLIISLLLGTGGFTSLVMIKELSSDPPSSWIVIFLSLIILVVATWFNLNLAAVKIVGDNSDLKEMLTQDRKEIVENAQKNNEADGIKL